jgi:hypothetical protein
MSKNKFEYRGKRIICGEEKRILGLVFYNFYECSNQFERIEPMLQELPDNTIQWNKIITLDKLLYYVVWEVKKSVYECSYEQVLNLLNMVMDPFGGYGQDIIISTTDVNNSDLFCFSHDGEVIIYKRKH